MKYLQIWPLDAGTIYPFIFNTLITLIIKAGLVHEDSVLTLEGWEIDMALDSG